MLHRTLALLAAGAALALPAAAHAGSYPVHASGGAALERLLGSRTPLPYPTPTSFAADYRRTSAGVGLAARTGGGHADDASASLAIPLRGLVLLDVSAKLRACAASTASGFSASVFARTSTAAGTRIAFRDMATSATCGDVSGSVPTPVIAEEVRIALRARTAARSHIDGTWVELRELAATVADDDAPTLAVTVARTSTAATTATVTATARDAASGIARITAQVDGGAAVVLWPPAGGGAVDRSLLRGQATGGADSPGSVARPLALPAVAGDHVVAVTARDVAGNESRYAAPVRVTLAPIPAQPGPAIEPGTARVGVSLTARTGTWLNAPSALAIAWVRVVDGRRESAGAGATYTPTRDDARRGARLLVQVVATNAAGSASAESAPLAPVLPATPVPVATPTVVGVARVDRTVVVAPGAWDDGGGALAFAYRWEACADLAGTACSQLAGAGSALVAPAAALGRRLRVVVTATNAGGRAEAASAPGEPVLADAPTFARPPRLVGTGAVGAAVDVEPGAVEWHGATGTLATRLLRCAGGTCVELAAPAPARYAVAPGDRGNDLRVEVVATSAAGTAQASSAPLPVAEGLLPPVAPVAPADLPSIAGAPVVGTTLTGAAGRFTGPDPFALAFRWERCARACSAIVGADEAAYRVRTADLGARLRLVVTAANGAGAASATSAATAPVRDREHDQHVTGSGLGWAEASVDGLALRLDARVARRLVAAGGALVVTGRVRAAAGLPRPRTVRVALRLDAPVGGAVVRSARVRRDGRFTALLPARFGGALEVATAPIAHVRPLAVDAGRVRVRPRIAVALALTADDLTVRGRMRPAAAGLHLDLLVRWPGASRWVLFGVEQEPVVTRRDGRFRLVLHSDTGYYVPLMRRARFRLAYRAEAGGPLASGSSPAVAVR